MVDIPRFMKNTWKIEVRRRVSTVAVYTSHVDTENTPQEPVQNTTGKKKKVNNGCNYPTMLPEIIGTPVMSAGHTSLTPQFLFIYFFSLCTTHPSVIKIHLQFEYPIWYLQLGEVHNSRLKFNEHNQESSYLHTFFSPFLQLQKRNEFTSELHR